MLSDKQRQYEKERRDWYKEHGICVRCHTENAKEGHTLCWRCLANANDYARIYYHSKTTPRSKQQIEKDKKARDRLTQKRNEEGLCYRCGLYPPIGKGKYSKCRACNDKTSKQKREREHAKGVLPQELRGDGLYCFHCCKPICNGEKLCSECAKTTNANFEKGRLAIDYKKHHWHKTNSIFFMD